MGKSGKRRGYRARSQREQAQDAARAAAAQAEAARLSFYKRLVGVLCAGLMVIALVFGAVSLARSCQGDIALSTPHYRVDTAMLAYYFYDYYHAELGEKGDAYAAAGLDPEKPLGEQIYKGETTWEAHFMAEVKASLRRMLVFAEVAYKEGVAPSYAEKCRQAADETVAALQIEAEENGQALADYLAAQYSNRVDEATVRRAEELSALAEARYAIFAAETYTEEERMALYATRPDDFKTGDVIAYSIKVDMAGLTGEAAIREAYQQAEARAQTLAAAGSEEAFCAAMAADLQAQNPGYTARTVARRVDEAYIYHIPAAATGLAEDWLNEPGRQAGDTAVLGATGDYTVVYCLNAPREVTYHRASARYILLPYAAYQTDALAREAADGLLTDFLAGAPSAKDFEALALQHTAAAGIALERVAYGDIEKPLCDWLTDEARGAGDTAVIAGVEGYYILYYTEKAPLPLWQELIADALREADYRVMLQESGLTVYENACTVPAL